MVRLFKVMKNPMAYILLILSLMIRNSSKTYQEEKDMSMQSIDMRPDQYTYTEGTRVCSKLSVLPEQVLQFLQRVFFSFDARRGGRFPEREIVAEV